MKQPLFIIIDLFCGFGGTTKGFVMARLMDQQIAKVVACINHDPKAIKSHWLDNPEVKHFKEDIRTLDLTELKALVNFYRILYPDAKLILWASLECTNFSKAKGGQPRNADSRTLADHLDRYVIALDPDYIKIENVVEFMSWGPLDENGKPISRKNGQDWIRWRKLICSHGYFDEWRELNSANYGAYTSRNRLFGVFAKPWLPIAWPEATHSKNPSKLSMHGDLKKWMPVKDVLNFEDEGQSIFTRLKSLSDNTLDRIYAGCIKYVAKGDDSFISKYYSGRPANKNIPVHGPAGTITTVDSQSLVQAEFLAIYNGASKVRSVNEPCPVVATNDRFGLVQPEYFIDKHYGNKSQNQSIDDPAGTLMPNDKHRLVTTEPFLMPTNYKNKPKSVDEPAPTITANRKHHYLINPSWGGNPGSIEEPCCTIVARQDKAPLYFVEVESGPVSIAVYDNDSEISIKIKKFMAAHGLVDIKMRMLRVPELLQIQGFPSDYQMVGNQSDQKKFIGNSVVPLVVKAWAESLGVKLIDHNQKVA